MEPKSQRPRTIGDHSSAKTRNASGQQAWLTYLGSPANGFAEAGSMFLLEQATTLRFGRGSAPHIEVTTCGNAQRFFLPLAWVSHTHAELRVVRTDEGFEFDLRDLGSRNGLFIESHQVPGHSRLRPGDVFELGRSFWTITVTERHAAPSVRFDISPDVSTCDPQLASAYRTLTQLAPTATPVFIWGETGTGKEVLAREVHRMSGRTGAFVHVNVASAFAEPKASKYVSLVQSAKGGTLFLDGLEELGSEGQTKLLAVLSDSPERQSTIEQFGIRLIGASLHDLEKFVEAGTFRPDLYSRLRGFQVELPPLRARRLDMGVFAQRVLEKVSKKPDFTKTRMGASAFRALLHHRWSGNLREFEKTLETAAFLCANSGKITRQVLESLLDSGRRQESGLEVVLAFGTGPLHAGLSLTETSFAASAGRHTASEGVRTMGPESERAARASARAVPEVYPWFDSLGPGSESPDTGPAGAN